MAGVRKWKGPRGLHSPLSGHEDFLEAEDCRGARVHGDLDGAQEGRAGGFQPGDVFIDVPVHRGLGEEVGKGVVDDQPVGIPVDQQDLSVELCGLLAKDPGDRTKRTFERVTCRKYVCMKRDDDGLAVFLFGQRERVAEPGGVGLVAGLCFVREAQIVERPNDMDGRELGAAARPALVLDIVREPGDIGLALQLDRFLAKALVVRKEDAPDGCKALQRVLANARAPAIGPLVVTRRVDHRLSVFIEPGFDFELARIIAGAVTVFGITNMDRELVAALVDLPDQGVIARVVVRHIIGGVADDHEAEALALCGAGGGGQAKGEDWGED